MTEPVLVGELLPSVLQEVIDRAGPGYDRWAEQVATTSYLPLKKSRPREWLSFGLAQHQ
jgi:hypothetical protein